MSVSAKRSRASTQGPAPKRTRATKSALGPLPVLSCPFHDCGYQEHICVCELPVIEKIVTSTTRLNKKEAYSQIAMALTPPEHTGRLVVLPNCIHLIMGSSSQFLKSSAGVSLVVSTPKRQ